MRQHLIQRMAKVFAHRFDSVNLANLIEEKSKTNTAPKNFVWKELIQINQHVSYHFSSNWLQLSKKWRKVFSKWNLDRRLKYLVYSRLEHKLKSSWKYGTHKIKGQNPPTKITNCNCFISTKYWIFQWVEWHENGEKFLNWTKGTVNHENNSLPSIYDIL